MQDMLGPRRIIPVIEIEKHDDAAPLAEALLAGGIDVIEVTFRTAAGALAIERIRKAYPKMLVGAGTVVTQDQASRAIDLGVAFGVAPGLNPKIVEFFMSSDTPFLPGVVTPSEIERALSLGCRMLKFFPAEASGGIPMLKALAGPYASLGIRFCPTGGINRDNMNDYLSLPLVTSIGGSWIATKQQIANHDWDTITRQAKDALARCE
jgi:2-dehydro-3-deoxyphosphogluconate aldolase/(4S)-4-hydroxy-2-oxoglutarate aldolase